MADKMTPGPWFADCDKIYSTTRRGIICWVGIGFRDGAEYRANARAIAALPDLIDAARAIAEIPRGDADELISDATPVPIVMGRIRALRAALAKAESRS